MINLFCIVPNPYLKSYEKHIHDIMAGFCGVLPQTCYHSETLLLSTVMHFLASTFIELAPEVNTTSHCGSVTALTNLRKLCWLHFYCNFIRLETVWLYSLP